MSELNIDGMTLAPGVVETIVNLAVSDVEGVAGIGVLNAAGRGIRNVLGGKPAFPGIEVFVDDDGKLCVGVHIDVKYGSVLPDVAEKVRQAIANAVAVQVGVTVGVVDVYIDGVQFEN